MEAGLPSPVGKDGGGVMERSVSSCGVGVDTGGGGGDAAVASGGGGGGGSVGNEAESVPARSVEGPREAVASVAALSPLGAPGHPAVLVSSEDDAGGGGGTATGGGRGTWKPVGGGGTWNPVGPSAGGDEGPPSPPP